MYCIKCNSEMKKCQMYGVLLDFCYECKSVWVDGSEMDSVIYNIKNTKKDLIKQCKIETAKEKNSYNSCIICQKCKNTSLEKYFTNGMILEKCPICNGVFFDKDELEKIILKSRKSIFYTIKRILKWIRQLLK